MEQLIFASNNLHKVEEIQSAIGDQIRIISLRDAGIEIEIPEPHETLEENASAKSKTIYRLTSKNCFSEDTGLEVEALNGRPGVKSARYAGEEKNFEKNIRQVLAELSVTTNRKARFRTVVSLIMEGTEFLFDGTCAGIIIEEPRGSAGFGYDSVFVPDGSNRTFAEMGMQEKNRYSHRKKAADRLVLFLQQQYRQTRTN